MEIVLVFVALLFLAILVGKLLKNRREEDTRPWWEIEQDRIDKQKKGK